MKNLRRFVAEVVWSLRPHLSGIGTVPSARRTRRWLPGLHRASPSTPLDVSSYVRATLASIAVARRASWTRRHGRLRPSWRAQRAGRLHLGANPVLSDEPRSPRAQPAQATPSSN